MKNCNLLYSTWHYKITIKYKVEDRQYYEDFDVITRKNYGDIHEQFAEFIARDLKNFYQGYVVSIISAEVVDLECLNW